jgi:hypothetical protein
MLMAKNKIITDNQKMDTVLFNLDDSSSMYTFSSEANPSKAIFFPLPLKFLIIYFGELVFTVIAIYV